MTALRRESPKLPQAYSKEDVRQAVDILEDRPRVPEKTPSAANADGYEGEICYDGTYLYIYRSGGWKRAQLSTW